jgi:hypothetical protein
VIRLIVTKSRVALGSVCQALQVKQPDIFSAGHFIVACQTTQAMHGAALEAHSCSHCYLQVGTRSHLCCGYVVDLVHKSSSTSDMLAGPGDLYDAMRSWPKVELLFAYQLVIQSWTMLVASKWRILPCQSELTQVLRGSRMLGVRNSLQHSLPWSLSECCALVRSGSAARNVPRARLDPLHRCVLRVSVLQSPDAMSVVTS